MLRAAASFVTAFALFACTPESLRAGARAPGSPNLHARADLADDRAERPRASRLAPPFGRRAGVRKIESGDGVATTRVAASEPR